VGATILAQDALDDLDEALAIDAELRRARAARRA
jgi:hypothetical protein